MWNIKISIDKDGTVIGVEIDASEWLDEDTVRKIVLGIIEATKFAVPEWHNANATYIMIEE